MLHKNRTNKSRVNAIKATYLDAAHNMESASTLSASDVWDQRSHLGPAEEATQEDTDLGNQAELISKSDIDATETYRSNVFTNPLRKHDVLTFLILKFYMKSFNLKVDELNDVLSSRHQLESRLVSSYI